MTTLTNPQSHQWAVYYARRQIEVFGVDPDRLRQSWAHTPHSGYGAPGEPGYEVAHGVMRVPWMGGHKFNASAIIDEALSAQGDMFRS